MLTRKQYSEAAYYKHDDTVSYPYSYRCKRSPRINDFILPFEQCTGEKWKDKAKKLFLEYSLEGKKVLDIGCAFGFIVNDLREMGVDAWGIDFSSYACANSECPDYVYEEDARTYLSTFGDNEFDLVILMEVLCCFTDVEITALLLEVKRIAKEVHIVEFRCVDTDSYNYKEPAVWDLVVGTGIVVSDERGDEWQLQ